MKKKFLYMVTILLFMAVNLVIISDMGKYTKHYPFNRLLVGDTFLYRLSPADTAMEYGCRLDEIDSKRVEAERITDRLMKIQLKPGLTFLCEKNDKTHTVSFQGTPEQGNIGWLFMLLMLIGNVCWIWGFVVGILHARSYQAYLYFVFSCGYGLFLLMLVDVFSFRRLILIFILAIAITIIVLIRISCNLANRRMGKLGILLSVLVSFILGILYILYTSIQMHLQIFLLIVFALFLSSVLLAVMATLIYALLSMNRYIRRRNIAIVVVMSTGVLVPLGLLLAGLLFEHDVTPQVCVSFAVAVPVALGNSLLSSNFIGSVMNIRKSLVFLFFDVMIALITGISLYYIVNNFGFLSSGSTLLYVFFVICVMALLHIRRILIRRFDDVLFLRKDSYALSLQYIAELVSSPQPLDVKMRKIFTEVQNIVNVQKVRFVVFDYIPDDHGKTLSGYVEYSSRDSFIADFFTRFREPVLRYSLMSSSLLEHRIYTILDEEMITIAAPVFIQNELQGLLKVGEKSDDEFFLGTELHYLNTVALQLHQLFENDRLFQEFIIKRRYEKELDLASYIQMRLFPKKAPKDAGVHISFYSRPYLKVTGDYFDFIKIGKKKMAFVVADISGHGLAAAMILSMTSAIVNGMLLEKKNIEKTVEEINNFLTTRYRGIELITFFIGVYDKTSRSLQYINAGHSAPMIRNAGSHKITRLEGRSKILGVESTARYYSSRYVLNKGDEIYLFTDGLTELYNENTDRTFGEQYLQEIILHNTQKDIEERVNAVIEAINDFGVEHVRDDITFLGIEIQ